MEMAFWTCQQCGDCCKGLLRPEEHGLEGLYLFPSEITLFPSEVVFPSAAQGMNAKAKPRPEEVILYQLAVERCPHLSDSNRCQIYESRPLVCCSFPFTPSGSSIVVDPECREHKRLRQQSYLPSKEHYEAFVQLSEALRPFLRAPWRFDLRSKRWKFIQPILAHGQPGPKPFPSYDQFVAAGGIKLRRDVSVLDNMNFGNAD